MDKFSAKATQRTDVRSSCGPFTAFDGLRITYPKSIIVALVALYLEYNRQFTRLIQDNREGDTDYRYCFNDNVPINYVVQIDMLGLAAEELELAENMDPEQAIQCLRRRIFEIENSWAMYQFLDRIIRPSDGGPSHYSRESRAVLDALREYFGKPIVLLAVTREKLIAMKATEFGKAEDEPITDAETRELSGFDGLWGPNEFLTHVDTLEALLFVRASDPVTKLKRPEMIVDHPLLADPGLRRMIKANTITLNIDNPSWSIGDPRRINDTKRYMPPMGMGIEIRNEKDLACFPSDQILRAKPLQGTYGCYGHARGVSSDRKFRHDLRRGLRDRGPYIVQPELAPPTAINTVDGQEYAFIDRVFLGYRDGRPVWLGGFREFLPSSSHEAQSGRLHGTTVAVCAEIL